MKNMWTKFRALPTWAQATSWIVVVAAVVGIAVGASAGGSSDQESPGETASTTKAEQTTAEAMTAAILESAGPGETDYGAPRDAEAGCTEGLCFASWNADTPAFDPEGTLIDSTFPVFAAAFSDATTKKVNIQISGQTTSVGGKDSLSQAVTITCARQADEQIDWEKVDASGIKALCTYVPHVKFD